MNAATALSIPALRRLARARLPRFAWERMEGGDFTRLAGRANSDALEAVRFAPRILADTRPPAQKTTLLGLHYDGPLAVGLPQGGGWATAHVERCLWRAARMANLPFVLPAASAHLLEQCLRDCGSAPWLELPLLRDHQLMRDMLDRARHAGCEVLVLSAAPQPYVHAGPRLSDAAAALLHPRWLCAMLPRLMAGQQHHGACAQAGKAGPDWRDLIWLRTAWRGKLVLKGVLRPDDAKLAAQLGADGLMICDDGGQGGCAAAMSRLPHIVAASGGQVAILVEGQVSSGLEVAKALALGAHMVMAGRAALYGAAAGSQAGAERALQILRIELDRVLTLIGCASVQALGPSFLTDVHRPSRRARTRTSAQAQAQLPPGVLRFPGGRASVFSLRPAPGHGRRPH